ncbi:MAG: MvdC/MvdD family ATP grasp protein [Candidatus Thorarchaeota archaeon]
MILILSNKWDISVDFVIRELQKRNYKFLRINCEDLPNLNVSFKFPNLNFVIKNNNENQFSNNLKSIWFRRPGKAFEFDNNIKKEKLETLKFIQNQWISFIDGLRALKNVFWINDPIRNEEAENKILQLKIAESIGFKIPKTYITNDKELLNKFISDCKGEIILKALYSPLIEGDEKDYFIFTNKVSNLKDFPASRFKISPIIAQEYIKDKIDYRVTVIGNEIFAVKILLKNGSLISSDWRLINDNISFIPCKLSNKIARKCLKLVRRLGLVFGAIDLLEVNSKFIFLEINPNGEWGWLETQTEYPIAKTISDCLIKGEL